MYPRLSDLIEQGLGIPLPFPIYSFGAMVALAILLGVWLVAREMDRLYEAGRLSGVSVPKRTGRGTTTVSPSVLSGTIAGVAAAAGVVGAKVFHILENLDAFMLDPAGMLFATGGLTFYGGLIVAGLALAWLLRRYGLSVRRMADVAAPSLMLGYGIGRIGCHLAGDGDWGIAANLAAKPDMVPMWLWAETYPHAIVGPPDVPVYPTPIYEAVACIALAGLLWGLRTHPFRAGWLFALYLVLNGIERFLIEQIRVNNTGDLLGFTVTQAEVIALGLVAAGIVGLALTTRRTAASSSSSASSTQPLAS
jgi:phosphatidylglycerol:prolipoprotein diacylglycerol transferase